MMKTHRGQDCCWHPITHPKLVEEFGDMACLRAAGHRGAHESLFWRAVEMDAFDRGADAMREIAANWVNKFCASGKAKAIRDLPPPEDN